jgi:DNA-binding response OmpR family regulator
MRILILDDNQKDLRFAAHTARSVGFENIETHDSLSSAICSLERGLRGEQPLPDVILVDLDLGFDSGFEMMRFWHSAMPHSNVRLVVWSLLADTNREVCALFKVDAYVGKFEGQAALHDALELLSRNATLSD